MAVQRETFVLGQDIKADQLRDDHPEPGTNLRKLVEKKVIDTFYLNVVPISAGAISKRFDLEFLDKPEAVAAGDIGFLTGQPHQVFKAGTDDAFVDPVGQEVTVDLVRTAELLFTITLTTGTNTGLTAGDPGDVQIGDRIRVQGQGTVSDFFTEITDKVAAGPNYLLTFADIFVQGITKPYTAERIARWEAFFKTTAGNPFPMPGTPMDLGFFQRVFLADVEETALHGPFKHPEFAPDIGGGGIACSTIELLLDPGESFVWFHGLAFDIPMLSWWVEWTSCYPVVRFFYGLQATDAFFLESQVQCPPTKGATSPVKFRHIDENSVEIFNENTVEHRVKAVGCRPT